jgi:hypothetical protein
MSLDFLAELKAAISAAAAKYGPAEDYRLLPVVFHDKTFAQLDVNVEARTVQVHLASVASTSEEEPKYELWHEAIHCLAPVRRWDTLWFEEGLATEFALKHTPISHSYKAASEQVMKPPWKDVLAVFRKLKATNTKVRSIREKTKGHRFDEITEEVVVEVFRAPKKLAGELCQRLSATGR